MNPVAHKTNTKVLGAPAGWDQTKVPCDALPVTEHNHDGYAVITSFWKPEPHELSAMNAGKPIMITVFGLNHPAIMVNVAKE